MIGAPVTCLDGILRKRRAIRSAGTVVGRGVACLFNLATAGGFRLRIDEVLVSRDTGAVSRIYRPSVKVSLLPPVTPTVEFCAEKALIGGDPSVYRLAKVVFFLTCSLDASREMIEAEDEALRVAFGLLGEGLVCRFHPRDEDRVIGVPGLNVDMQNLNWETLLALGLVNEGAILVGLGSSALLAPKRLFGKEPPLIYLCNMLRGGNYCDAAFVREWRTAEELYAEGRVFAPSSERSLADMMARLVRGQ